MLVAYDDDLWDDDNDDDDHDDDHDDDWHNGTLPNNRTFKDRDDLDFDDYLDWTLPANTKEDFFNKTLNRTVCINSVVYVGVINLDKPTNTTPVFLEARQLAASQNATISFVASPKGSNAFTKVASVFGLFVAVIATLSF